MAENQYPISPVRAIAMILAYGVLRLQASRSPKPREIEIVSAREVLTAVRDRDCSGRNRVKAPPPLRKR
jgi:hypothetical protein